MKKSKKDSPITLLSLEELSDSNQTLLSQFEYQTQERTCISLPSGLDRYRCSSCIGKKGGFVCAFIHIRSWIYEKHTSKLVGGPIFEPVNETAFQTSYRQAQFPIQFKHLPSHLHELIDIRRTIGKALKSVLERELIEFQNSQSVNFIGRRIDVSTQCDYCATTLIGVAWLCQQCGKEACVRCFNIFQSMSDKCCEQKEDQISAPGHNRNSAWLKRAGRCVKAFGSKHQPSSHFKVSHLSGEEISKYLEEIDHVLEQDISTTPPPTPFPIEEFIYHPPDSASDPYYKVDVNTLESNHKIFDQIWSSGVALVVTGIQDRMELPWDPEYLSKNYGEEQCNMLDSNSPHGETVTTNVRDFFERFKGSNSHDAKVWKLRDWPPEIDMNLKFRELFEDFQKAIPIGEITNRNGLKNVAAHFPKNANIPDIGPKMYIAMQTSDRSGSFGSTGLHMDMADAINIQTYARCNQEGIEGCSLWHLYHANDTDKLREFLYDHHARKLGRSVEEVKSKFDDPIHVSRTYIDVEMRKKLCEEYGVKGYEIRQKPGEAVFIPAYTAHQVCNLANCIKVAADFVSPTSIEKCIRLKEEFREQLHEQSKPWKGDVLQTEQMLLYAFDSLGRKIEEFET